MTRGTRLRIGCLILSCKVFLNVLWFEKTVYDVLATLAYRCEPDVPFNWFEGITFLSGIERDALGQWSRIPKRKK